MTGGLLNLVSEGNQNVFLTGNPSKTFFKSVYKKYTNFGLQRLRIDYNGQRYLSMEQDTVFSFKVCSGFDPVSPGIIIKLLLSILLIPILTD